MLQLYVFRNILKSFYAKYYSIIDKGIKYIILFTAMMLINMNLGYQTKLAVIHIPIVLSVIGAFLPYMAGVVIVAVFLLIHLFTASFELALIVGIIFILTIFLYYSFGKKDSVLLILVPIFFAIKIPYVIPLVVGLMGSAVSIIPILAGVLIYFTCLFAKQNIGLLTNTQSVDIAQRYTQAINGIFSNKTLLLFLIAFALATFIVYMVHKQNIDYAWQIAIAAGTITLLVSIFAGDFIFDISLPLLEFIIGLVVSVIFAYIYNFFVFSVDYTRTEYARFEDDDYYYFVKAVPKITITAADKKVQSFSTKKKIKNTGGSE
ncbi:MAG: ABC transporter permease [Lachnospiraceae bacterium oral taxon 082]|nr:ABC transporter permease [Lachnospiraceae bacterium oral taxon 082]